MPNRTDGSLKYLLADPLSLVRHGRHLARHSAHHRYAASGHYLKPDQLESTDEQYLASLSVFRELIDKIYGLNPVRFVSKKGAALR